jgi:predicted dehydrogenase/threonine dehydrogenase-like Zn-dependent dehydrogenase
LKQIIQNYRSGQLELADVPIPICSAEKILVKNIASLISIGTERSIIELGKKSLLGKAKARPDLAKRFMDKARNEGFIKTFKEALGRLDNPTPLGYSSAGIVVEAGLQVQDFSPNDRVACIGAGYASHAEYNAIPPKLCCKVPDNVFLEEACFGMLGIISLHGIRSANLSFGSTVVVIGLGLLGLLSVQLLRAYGCKTIGFDIDRQKVGLAMKLGTDYASATEEELKENVEKATSGYGADAVIITTATESEKPINIAVDVARFRGKIVLVGVAEVHPQRNEMWHKEVEIVVSKAGGPGTFDPFYENKGIDYPIGYVRWTEKRNLEEFLRLIAEKKVDAKSLISHRFKIDEAEVVYKNILENKGGPYIGVILEYPELSADDKCRISGKSRTKTVLKPKSTISYIQSDTFSVGVIGSGLFGKALLLPALKKVRGAKLKALATSSSENVYHVGRKYGFETCTTDYHEVLKDDEIEAVIILTPHSLHARMVCEALQSGKHTFVEKPLCINEKELKEIILTYQSLITNNQSLMLMVGYNRRFSPHANRIYGEFLTRSDPMVINYRINAGFVPPEHWVYAEEEGGGRIIGEICHFVDFMQLITMSHPIRVFGERISGNNRTALNNDNLTINLKFGDGSVGNIVYSANGDKGFSRERIEIFCEGKTVVSTDFRKTSFHSAGKKRTFGTYNQSMGYQEELTHFFDVIKGDAEPKLTPDEIFHSTSAVFSIHESLATGQPVFIDLP